MTRKMQSMIEQAILKQRLLSGEKIPDPSSENPIRHARARKILDIGSSRMSAIKRAMGISHARYVLFSEIRKFLRQNPTFTETQIYPRRSK